VRISSQDLLPGDVCSISSSKGSGAAVNCPADMLLLRGTCVVNEAMLTGESVPLLKEGIEGLSPSDGKDILAAFEGTDRRHTGHVLFSGSQVHSVWWRRCVMCCKPLL
jgi:cation-transporting ATPase 13A1